MKAEVMAGMDRINQAELRDIMKVVADSYFITVEDIQSGRRKRPIPDAKKTYCMIAKELNPDLTLHEVGMALDFGGDHSMVVYNYKKGKDLYEIDRYFRQKYDKCIALIRKLNGKKTGIISKAHIGWYYDKPDELKDYDLKQSLSQDILL